MNNPDIFNAAFTGALTGILSQRGQTSAVPTHYDPAIQVAVAIATEVDAGIAPGYPTSAEVDLIDDLTSAILSSRQPTSVVASDYAGIAAVIIAAFTEAEAQLV